jgi:peptidoglycan/xylan/chitin deacetylase (PgdA/CDA1 family)
VLITFDDGYANNFIEAFPILKNFGFRATIFVVVQTVGWENHWHDPKTEGRIPMISWPELKELQRAGWEIGSHTMNHPNLLKIEPKEVKQEMEKSRRIINEFLQENPLSFAYPYGAGEDREDIRSRAKECDYRLAVGIHAGKWTPEQIKTSPFNVPRIFVRGDETLFDFHLQITRGRSRL